MAATPESLPYRIARIEKDIEKLEELSDELRDCTNKINLLTSEVTHLLQNLTALRTEQADYNKRLSGRVDTLLKTFGLTALSIFIAIVTFVINSWLAEGGTP